MIKEVIKIAFKAIEKEKDAKPFMELKYFSLQVAKREKDLGNLFVYKDILSLIEDFQNKNVKLFFKGENEMRKIRAAIRNNDFQRLQSLIEQGLDINCSDSYGVTPIHLCCFIDRLDCFEVLVKNKAKIDKKDKRGRTPMDLAEKSKCKDKCLDILIKLDRYIHET